jgi:hypothetical protein
VLPETCQADVWSRHREVPGLRFLREKMFFIKELED